MNITSSYSAIPPALNSGTEGMAAANSRLTQSASKIASAAYADNNVHTNPDSKAVSGVERNEALLEMKREQLLFTASARVVKTSDNMIGNLLNIRV